MDQRDERLAAERKRRGELPRFDQSADFADGHNTDRRPGFDGYAIEKLIFDKIRAAFPTFIDFEASKNAEQAQGLKVKFSFSTRFPVKSVAFASAKVVYLTFL